MPKIHDYELQSNPVGPERQTQATEGDTGGLGNAFAHFGQQLEDAGDLIERRNGQAAVADTADKLSALHAEFTNKLHDRLLNATPEEIAGGTTQGPAGSQSIADKFMDEFSGRLTDIGGKVETRAGREYFQRAAARLQGHFSVASVQGQTSLAGGMAKQQMTSVIYNKSNALLNDPTTFQMSVDDLKDQVDHSPLLKDQNVRDALIKQGNENFAMAASRGWMQNADTPIPIKDKDGKVIDYTSVAKQQLKDGRWDSFITPAQKYTLLAEAKQHITGFQVEQERIKKEQVKVAADNIASSQNVLLDKIMSGKSTTKEILNDPGFAQAMAVDPKGVFAAKHQMIEIQRQMNVQKGEGDPAAANSLAVRIYAPEGTPGKIFDASQIYDQVATGKISAKQGKQLQLELQSTDEFKEARAQYNSFMTGAKGVIVGKDLIGAGTDPKSEQLYQDFRNAASAEYQRQIKAGLPPAQNFFNPKSPNYRGDMFKQYHQTLEEKVGNLATQMNAASMPGISPSATPTPPGSIRVSKGGVSGMFKGTAEEAVKKGYLVQ